MIKADEASAVVTALWDRRAVEECERIGERIASAAAEGCTSLQTSCDDFLYKRIRKILEGHGYVIHHISPSYYDCCDDDGKTVFNAAWVNTPKGDL